MLFTGEKRQSLSDHLRPFKTLTAASHEGYHGGIYAYKYSSPRSQTRVRDITMKNEGMPGLIRELRQRLNLTQEQLAEKVGVASSTVNHGQNGKRVPLPFLVKRLVELKYEFGRKLEESERYKAVKALARKTDHLLFLTAIRTEGEFRSPLWC